MTIPTKAPREALPEPLKVVAYRDRYDHFDLYLSAGNGGDREPLVRLSDAQSALESERQAHAAEVERLRGDAERWNEWLPWLRRLNKKPFNLAKEIDAIDQAIARGKT